MRRTDGVAPPIDCRPTRESLPLSNAGDRLFVIGEAVAVTGWLGGYNV
jgi:hypothetical protein